MFRRPLLTYAFDADPRPGIALCRALAGQADTLRLVLRVPLASSLALGNDDLHRFEQNLADADRAIAELARSLGAEGLSVVGEVVSGLGVDALAAAIDASHPDVVVFGDFGAIDSDVIAGFALETAREHGIPCAIGHARGVAIERLVHPFDGRRASLAAIAPFFRDHTVPDQRLVLVALGPRDRTLPGDMDAVEAITGVRAQIELASFSDALATQSGGIARGISTAAPDLLVVSTDFGRGFAPELVRAALLRSLPNEARPVLFVPPSTPEPLERTGTLDAFDALVHGEATVRLEHVSPLGRPAPLRDGSIELVAAGKTLARVEARSGLLRIPSGIEGPLGLGRHRPSLDPIHAIESSIEVRRTSGERIALLDARLDGPALEVAVRALAREDRMLIAVRLLPLESASAIRARFRAAGLPRPLVLDVRDVLDEGDATDVPVEVCGVRLARAAARFRTRGASIDAIVTAEPSLARGRGFVVLHAGALEDADARARAAFLAPLSAATDAATKLDALTGSSVVGGNAVTIELENDVARRTLFAACESARERVHAQFYIVEDDEVGREFEAVLVRVAGRGVRVRILVDSLYSLHDSFGAKNALLERLAHVPGIEVRAADPIVGVPGLRELKRRDHRKLVVVDGRRGIVSGRNLGETYYRGFSEVRLSPGSDWRAVPWLDASATLEGPIVAELDAAFREAFTEAGGDTFAIAPCAEAGDTAVRLVVHRGLADAYTLEAYLALIERARSRLVVVNSFPLQLEVQHAMLRAIERGVSLSLLVGNVRPLHGEGMPFAGGVYRAIADALVRSRIAALLEAGADVRELVIPPRPEWDAALGKVRPYVHAKLLCADARHLAVGSANLDVTAGYWESEAVVLIEDARLGRSLETGLEAWLASAEAIDPRDPAFREHADLRAWLGRVWPSVIG